MATLDEIIQIPGVVIASQFGPDGELLDYRISGDVEITDEMAGMCAELCMPVNIMFDTMAQEFMRFSDMKWLPRRGWAYSGGDWTVAMGDNCGVFVETAKADFNQLFHILVVSR